MTIIFYRILGNDIPLRHSPGQTLKNLAFILEHEPALPGAEKRFLLNRLIDANIKDRLMGMVKEAGFVCQQILFSGEEYRRYESVYQKGLYLTNQNVARNACIELGFREADVVLPFDGQVFFTAEGWQGLLAGLEADDGAKYLAVPMVRLGRNGQALEEWGGLKGEASEPQLVFRRGGDLTFNPSLSYGAANKVELLMRLGVPGVWDGWNHPLFDETRAKIVVSRSPSFGRVKQAGFVFRLESGNEEADRDILMREQMRNEGMAQLIARVEASPG